MSEDVAGRAWGRCPACIKHFNGSDRMLAPAFAFLAADQGVPIFNIVEQYFAAHHTRHAAA